MGTLYLVATPIGNLADISTRAVQILNSVHVIACEDTRTSSTMLQHHNINTPTISFHQHNEHRKVRELMELLAAGRDIALISDAGTPGLSDPGFLAARAAHRHGHPVCAIPGASAALTALTASGLPSDRFLFTGFLPAKKGRATQLDEIAAQESTVILYESVHRIRRLIDELTARCDKRRIAAVCRELTKQFEEIIRGPLPEIQQKLADHPHLKGEFVVILAGKNYTEE